jgi:hypothetical protein
MGCKNDTNRCGDSRKWATICHSRPELSAGVKRWDGRDPPGITIPLPGAEGKMELGYRVFAQDLAESEWKEGVMLGLGRPFVSMMGQGWATCAHLSFPSREDLEARPLRRVVNVKAVAVAEW